MKMVLEIPDDISAELDKKLGDAVGATLEALAAAAYSRDVLSLEQVRRLLGLETEWQARAVLSRHDAWPAMSVEDFREDAAELTGFLRDA